MRIGISCYPTFGGSGIVATELAMALAADGDEVHVISYALPSRLSFINSNPYTSSVIFPSGRQKCFSVAFWLPWYGRFLIH